MAGRNRRNIESVEENGNGEDIVHAAHEAMSDVSQRATSAALDLFNGPMAKLAEQNRAAFHKMVHAMQEESLRFVNRRLEHTGRAIESSRDCQGVTGLMAVQQEWLMDIARDYADQTKRFAELMRELAEDGTAGIAGVTSDVAARMRNGDVDHKAAAE